MKKFQYLRWLLLASVAGLMASCSLVPPDGSNSRARFHDGRAANVVFRFYSWDLIHMTQPDTRENGFLPLLNRESVAHELARPDVGRDLAVVVMGNLYSIDQETQLFQDWKALLTVRGFRRLVLVRASYKHKIDGLIIVRDSAIAAADDYQRKVGDLVAAVPPSAGADVADSPGYSVR
ncbi:MAG: hypothetical protein MUF81_04075 [Verrucomicrobia bacterium]|jgi:hypothetical protein|nr:hypothetical protein [Verrucomicrobiota bacterium]